MKTIIFFALTCIFLVAILPVYSIGQDSTKIANFKMTVRLSNCFSVMLAADDDLFYAIRKADKAANFPQLTDSITIDTVLVTDLVIMYDRFYGLNFGIADNAITWLRGHTTAARLANSNLERQMAAIETKWTAAAVAARQSGMARQRRKN